MDEDELIASVGARLKQLRYAAGHTQEAMATRVGSGLRNYQRLETGQVNMSLRTLARLAVALDVAPADLLVQPSPRTAGRGSGERHPAGGAHVAGRSAASPGKRRPRR
jgi:transcriptional regulator with XRE-family HTH domain